MRITTLDYGGSTDGLDFVADLTKPDHGTEVELVSITVDRLTLTDVTVAMDDLVIDTPLTISGLTFTLRSSGSIDISGLTSKDWISWTTDGTHDRVLVEALSGQWDIGAFEVAQLTTQTNPIGGQIVFADDAPTVDLGLLGGLTITLDESVGVDVTDANADDGAPLAQVSKTAAQYLATNTASAGTDGAKATIGDVWSLSTIEGADSGLIAVDSGLHVFLFLESGEIVGRIGATKEAAESGDEALRFEIDASGTVTATLSLALQHPDGTDGDDAVAMTGTDLVKVTHTVTDADNDARSDSVDLTGAFSFEDDAPVVNLTAEPIPELVTGDGDLASGTPDTATANFADLFDPDFGEDEAADTGPVAYTLDVSVDGVESGLVDSLTSQKILLKLDGTTVVGYLQTSGETAFTITVDTDGDVTLSQYRAVVHGDDTDPLEADTPAVLASAGLVTLTATATDGDTDTAFATKEIGGAFKFQDDGPSVSLSGETVDTLVTDDTTLSSDGPVDMSKLFNVDSGNDGDGGVTYALGVSSTEDDSGLVDTLTGEHILLRLDAVTGNVEGYLETSGDVAFTISVDPDTGAVSLSQDRAIYHDNDADGIETGPEAEGLASAGLVTLTATASDGDDDTATQTAEIGDLFRFEDDAPDVTLSGQDVPLLVTDDTDLTVTDTDSFALLFQTVSGNDGPSTMIEDVYALEVKGQNIDSGLADTETGDPILLRLTAGGVVEGYVSGTDDVAFTITVDEETGEVTLAQLRAIRHDNATDGIETGGEAERMAADLISLSLTSYDGDGDSDKATVPIGDAFAFEDDAPEVTLTGEPLTPLIVSDSDLGSAGPVSFADLFDFDFGGDKAAAIASEVYTLSVSTTTADSGLVDSATGSAILLRLVDGKVEGYLADDTDEISFVISVSTAGAVSIDLLRAVQHDDPLDPEETGDSAAKMVVADLIRLTATITDGDGDTDSASVDIATAFSFTDDGPTFAPIDDIVVDFAKVAGPGVVVSDSSALTIDTGNDKPVSVEITDYAETLVINGMTLKANLSADGSLLQYYADANNNGFDNGDKVYFKYQLTDTDADAVVDTATFTIVDTPLPPTLDYNFRDLPAGQNGFGILGGRGADGQIDQTGTAILIVGDNTAWKGDGTFTNASSTINTSKGGGPTTIGLNNQMIDPNEGVWFSYLNNVTPSYISGVTGGLDQTEADDFDNIDFNGGLEEVTQAFFKIVQVQGRTVSSLEINAYDFEEGTTEGTALLDMLNKTADGITTYADQVMVTSVTFSMGTFTRAAGDNAFVDWQDDGGVTLNKVVAGDSIVFITDEGHDAALITGLTGKFDIGDYGIFSATDTPDFSFDVDITVTDSDGDSATQTNTVYVDGTGTYDDGLFT